MKFNSSNLEDNIVDDIDFWCGTDSTSFPIEDKTRRVNQWYYKTQKLILNTDGRFQFHDRNDGNLPEMRANLVDGQGAYELPDDYIEVHAVEVKDTNGDFYRLEQIDIQDLDYSISNYRDTKGAPAEYDLTGNVIRFFPAPDKDQVTLSNGFKVYISRSVSVFDTSDTTKEPGFDNAYHQILSLGPSADYLSVNGTQEDHDNVVTKLETLQQQLKSDYSNRNVEGGTAVRPERTNSLAYH